MSLLLAGITLDMAEILNLIFIFFDHLSGIDVSGWMTYLTAFMTFVFLRHLVLRLTVNR